MNSENIDAGQDSFLDIVANLVGILIILVVVVGAQAKSVWTSKAVNPEDTEQVSGMLQEIDGASILTERLARDHELIRAQIREERVAVDQIERNRHALMVQLQVVKQDIENQKVSLDERARKVIEKKSELMELQTRAASLDLKLNAIAADAQPRRETIDHYPTPIAKTVFSEEVHFHLKDNRLAFVPLDQLMRKMKAEWRVKADKLKRVKNTIETVQEVAGFRLQYELEAFTDTRNTEMGRVSREVVQFRQFVIIPTRFSIGDPVAEALDENSEFFSYLARKKPANTTVSIWVYPDSFESFNQVKDWLHERGYQAAAWPLSEGSLISGSPDGLRSSAQ